jgi:uncharacterized protein with PIN domain
MQIRLCLDEDSMSRALAHNLRLRGIDVTTVAEEGRDGLTDAEQLEFAASQGRVIYTCNVGDFFQLHTEYLAQGKAHASAAFQHRRAAPPPAEADSEQDGGSHGREC